MCVDRAFCRASGTVSEKYQSIFIKTITDQHKSREKYNFVCVQRPSFKGIQHGCKKRDIFKSSYSYFLHFIIKGAGRSVEQADVI